MISMGQCKKDVTSLITHWSYIFLAPTHRYNLPCARKGTGVGVPSDKYTVLVYKDINGSINISAAGDNIWRHGTWVNIGSSNGFLPKGTKPLPIQMLTSHKLDSQRQIPMKLYLKIQHFHENIFKKMHLKVMSARCWPFCSSVSELNTAYWQRR